MDPIQHYEDERPCPNCLKTPTLRADPDAWVVECMAHGHMAKGETLKEAIHHWNLYIEFVTKGAL